MSAETLSQALGGIDLKYTDEAINYLKPRARRHMSLKLAAAIVAAALLLGLGSIGVASTIYGTSMADMLGMLWQRDTGSDMSAGQQEVIRSMTQEVSLSQSVDNVTVNVTSARASGYDLWLLLRVEGVNFEAGESYAFADAWVDLTPEPTSDNVGVAGTHSVYQGTDGDGAGLFMVQYDTTALPKTGDALSVSLTLANLELRNGTDSEAVAAGPWAFEFELEFAPDDVSISLPDTTVQGYDPQRNSYADMTLRDIELTSSHISYTCDGGRDYLGLVGRICAVLADGSTVQTDTGGGGETDSGDWYLKLLWEYPIDLDEVVALRIGQVEIPVQ